MDSESRPEPGPVPPTADQIERRFRSAPVVVTRHSGIPEMVRGDKEALFVPPRDPEAIAEAVQQFTSESMWQAASRHARSSTYSGRSSFGAFVFSAIRRAADMSPAARYR